MFWFLKKVKYFIVENGTNKKVILGSVVAVRVEEHLTT